MQTIDTGLVDTHSHILMQTIDTGLVDTQQQLVLTEIRCLLLHLGSEIGLLTPAFVEAAMATTWSSDVRRSHVQPC
jgi:hypothetical protein